MITKPLDAIEHFQNMQMHAVMNEDIQGALENGQFVKRFETLKQSFDMLMK